MVLTDSPRVYPSWSYVVVYLFLVFFFFFQAEDGIRDGTVTGVQTCALPIYLSRLAQPAPARAAGADRRALPAAPVPRPPRPRRRRRRGAARGRGARGLRRRSEERRVGKEWRSRWSPYTQKKKKSRIWNRREQ